MASLKRSVRTHFGTQAEINGWRFKDEWAPAWPLKLVTAYPSQWSSILPPPGPVFQQGCGKASGAQFFQSSSKTYRMGLVGSVQPRLLDNRGDLAFASGQAATWSVCSTQPKGSGNRHPSFPLLEGLFPDSLFFKFFKFFPKGIPYEVHHIPEGNPLGKNL